MAPKPRREWVGNRVTLPAVIEDQDVPYRPRLVLWLALPEGELLAAEVIHPDQIDGSLGRVLEQALAKAGRGRRPAGIRVPDAALAAEARAVADAIAVTVAPTPELDEVVEELVGSMQLPGPEYGYLDEGRVKPETAAHLYAAAAELYRIAPWEDVADDQVVRLDIPALDVEGACVSVIGALGESLGLLIFPSLHGFVAFLEAAERGPDDDGAIDVGTDWLALNYVRGADLSDGMRREAAEHGWPVAAPDAYPAAQRFDADGVIRPPAERDVQVVAAAAAALGEFFGDHGELFQEETAPLMDETYTVADGIEARVMAPAAAAWDYDPTEDDDDEVVPEEFSAAERRLATTGRNDRCPCGSGRKYKKCHYAQDREAQSGRYAERQAQDLHEGMVDRLVQFAFDRHGIVWQNAVEAFPDIEMIESISVPWCLYHQEFGGSTVLDSYVEMRARHLAPERRAWLAAQQRAWLTVWEVVDVDPGQGLALHDLLSDETRTVRERSASRILTVRSVVLGRVIDLPGHSEISGLYPRALEPAAAAEVIRRARKRLRRKRAVPIERLRDPRFGRHLIDDWVEAVYERELAAATPPRLSNSDGDPFLLTEDHFDVKSGARDEILARLAALDGVIPPEPDDDPPALTFTRPGPPHGGDEGNTVVGHAFVSDTRLQAHTNSQARADALRATVESVCGDLVSHRSRVHTDPRSPEALKDLPPREPQELPPEALAALADIKRCHYATWPDEPLPALGGRTPREVVRTADGRREVATLINHMEHGEHRLAQGEPFDFSELRRELGLEGKA